MPNELFRAPCKRGRMLRPFRSEYGRDWSEDIIFKVANIVASRVILDRNNKSLVFAYGPRGPNFSRVSPDYLAR